MNNHNKETRLKSIERMDKMFARLIPNKQFVKLFKQYTKYRSVLTDFDNPRDSFFNPPFYDFETTFCEHHEMSNDNANMELINKLQAFFDLEINKLRRKVSDLANQLKQKYQLTDEDLRDFHYESDIGYMNRKEDY